MSELPYVSDSDFDERVLQSKRPVMVDFTADWCAPCAALKPTIETLAREYDGEVDIVLLNIDKSPETRDRFGIRGVPTLLIVKDGEERARISGGGTLSSLSAKLDAVLGDA